MDMLLIKNATIHSPELLEVRNIVVAGGQIVGLTTDEFVKPLEGMLRELGGHVLDARNNVVVPGFVDIHLHLIGGGGELGFESQTPSAKLSELLNAGLTTVVGVLGTDSITRSPDALLAKVEALNNEGVTAFMYTGAYRVPPPTITGSVMKDIAFIKPCIGLGEIAICDHRSSHASGETLAKLASECRIGGMLAGKAGVMYFHTGHGHDRLKSLRELVANTEIPITQLLPTHVTKSPELWEESIEWVKAGGYIDITARDKGTFQTLARAKLLHESDDSFSMDRIICSSDSYGSLPRFDENGNLVSYGIAGPGALLAYVKEMYFSHMWSLADVLAPITSNPARFLKLDGKGRIDVGECADILILDRHTLDLQYVIAKGEVCRTPKYTKRGMTEPGYSREEIKP